MNNDVSLGSRQSFKDFGFKDEEQFNQWKESPSGRIYSILKAHAAADNKIVDFNGFGSKIEVFSVDGQNAKLYKVLHGGTVGEDDGDLAVYFEAWEYLHYPWWKSAIDTVKIFASPLPFPLFRIAENLKIENWKKLFKPQEIIKEFGLNPENYPPKSINYVGLEKSIITVMQKCLNPVLQPHFKIQENMYLPRLIPLTNEAKLSLANENDELYKFAANKIRDNLNQLQKGYEDLKPSPTGA